MSYLHINNLYKDKNLLLFKECYALEKIHGSSSHIAFNWITEWNIRFFSGGESHERFLSIFDKDKLFEHFKSLNIPQDRSLIIYGEVYGGKCQGMSATYGKDLKFCAFDVKIGEWWLSVPDAEELVKGLGLEFVSYVKSSTDIDALNACRDADSVQAIRNGIGPGKKMEGVVLRPLIEMRTNNGERVIAKHKRDEFRETKTPRDITVDPAKLKILEEATAIADEWVTLQRLGHILDKIPNHSPEKMVIIINAMIEDVIREGAGEIVDSKEVRKTLGSRTAQLYKTYLQKNLKSV